MKFKQLVKQIGLYNAISIHWPEVTKYQELKKFTFEDWLDVFKQATEKEIKEFSIEISKSLNISKERLIELYVTNRKNEPGRKFVIEKIDNLSLPFSDWLSIHDNYNQEIYFYLYDLAFKKMKETNQTFEHLIAITEREKSAYETFKYFKDLEKIASDFKQWHKVYNLTTKYLIKCNVFAYNYEEAKNLNMLAFSHLIKLVNKDIEWAILYEIALNRRQMNECFRFSHNNEIQKTEKILIKSLNKLRKSANLKSKRRKIKRWTTIKKN